MISPRIVGPDAFDPLTAADDDAEAVATLRSAQYDRRVLLLRAALDQVAAATPGRHEQAQVGTAYGLLVEIQSRSPELFREAVLRPDFGAWAATLLRHPAEPSGGDPDTLALDALHLGAIAAGLAIRAGLPCCVDVPVRRGAVLLPGLGLATLDGAGGLTSASVEHTGSRTVVRHAGGSLLLPRDLSVAAPGWRPTPRHRLAAGGGDLATEVEIDDVGPYRSYHGLVPIGPLPADAVERWRRRLDEAWDVLAGTHPHLAAGLAVGVTSVVPLAEAAPGHGVSATSADAFGAIAVSLPATATDLAVALVHEFQHSKLAALIQAVPLFRAGADLVSPHHYAPWRNDPRPLPGLLQGCYAHFGIADFWRAQRHVAGPVGAGPAHFEFARWRAQTFLVTGRLRQGDALTGPGRRFVERLHGTLAGWQSLDTPAEAAAAAALAAQDHWLTWRLRNLTPDPARVGTLAAVWRRGAPCPDGDPTATVDPGDFTSLDDPRTQLRRRRLRGLDGTGGEEDAVVGATAADVLLVSGEPAVAAELYAATVGASEAPIGAWSGLAQARALVGDSDGPVFGRRPELVRAIVRHVHDASGVGPDPVALARWLAPALAS